MEHGRTDAPARAGRVRVLCVDDNEDVIDALRLLLSREPRLEWAGWLPTPASCSARRMHAGDIVLLDVDMPGRDPFEALYALAGRVPTCASSC